MKISLKKTVTAAMLAALTVALSGFYIPIGVSKCYPIQHMVNVLCAVFLGPGYGVMAAFCTSLIRNLMGPEVSWPFRGAWWGRCSAESCMRKRENCCPHTWER